MKQFFRKWLEVPEVPNMSKYVKTDDIKKAVEDAIYEALQPELPERYKPLFWDRGRDKDIRGTLQRHVKMLISEDAKMAVQKNVNELVEPEGFIDGVVERIKNKQLAT